MIDDRPIDFDPQTGANALEWLAEHALGLAEDALDAACALLRAAAGILCDARAWLDRHRTPFEDFAGQSVVQTVGAGTPLLRDEWVAALRNTAVELRQVYALIQQRGMRPS